MGTLNVDISNCDLEPIRTPGYIQGHGFLIVLDEEHIIRFFSANTARFLGNIDANVTGKNISYIESFFTSVHKPGFIAQLINIGKVSKNFEQVNPFPVEISGAPFNLVISTSGPYYLLEFEQSTADFDVQRLIGRSVSEMLVDKNLQLMLNNTAMQVKKIIHFDRVMIYRFAEDGHGEVIAEARNEQLPSWLGLHYPASDIPKQARELYKLNLTRLIANVNDEPSPILAGSPDVQLDLTNAQLRAVSPMHIQYLKNMGVASSFSISLLYKNELWGLIACHHYTPKFIDYKARKSAELIGQILSSALEYRQDEENLKTREIFQNNVDRLSKYLHKAEGIGNALTTEAVNLLHIVRSTGAVLVYDKKLEKLGITPNEAQLKKLLCWIGNNIKQDIFHTTNLSALYPEANEFCPIASGMLVVEISRKLNEFIIWFKPEIIQTIHWAGNPDKPVEIVADSIRISPRHSFELWSQTVSGTSEKWTSEELTSVTRLKEEISYALHLKEGALLALNEKLRNAYEELDSFSYTISHDLKNPITAIKGYAQILSADETIDMMGQKILLRISEISDKMHFMINEVLNYSRIGRSAIKDKKINMQLLIMGVTRDLEHVYDTGKMKITIGDTPDLYGDPVMISQVFSNLIGNAMKYSQHANPATVSIRGSINEDDICYTITDNGIGIAAQDYDQIFELFHRTENAKAIEGTGVGLAIAKRIVEKHSGRIWAESELNKGSSFFVCFKNKIIPANG